LTLKEKYNPIFENMEQILQSKKMEYMDQMVTKLESNYEQTMLEKQTLNKLEKSLNMLKPYFKAQLQGYLKNIEVNQKTHEEIKAKGKKEGKEEEDETDVAKQMQVVDSDQIKTIAYLIDEFNNIVAKNFTVYGQYDDFSFANTRSSEKMEEKLLEFFKAHFSGEF